MNWYKPKPGEKVLIFTHDRAHIPMPRKPFNIANPLTWPPAFLVKPDHSVRIVSPINTRFTTAEVKERFFGECVVGALEVEASKEYIMLCNGPLQTGQFPTQVNGDASFLWTSDTRCKQMVMGDVVVCHKDILPKE